MSTLWLLADFEDVIRAIVPIVVIIIWVVSQVMGNREKGANRPAQQRRAEPPPNKEAVEADAAIREQVEQFLRQAAEQRANAPPAAGDPAPQKAKTKKSAAKAASGLPSSERRGTPEGIEPLESEGLEGRRLKSQIGTSSFEKRVSHLGEVVGLADEKLAERLHKKFDHTLGRLSRSLPEQPEPAESSPRNVSLADEIAAMLRNPASVRQAFLLSEIFNPPLDRW